MNEKKNACVILTGAKIAIVLTSKMNRWKSNDFREVVNSIRYNFSICLTNERKKKETENSQHKIQHCHDFISMEMVS